VTAVTMASAINGDPRVTSVENICGCMSRQPCVRKTMTLAQKFQELS
jgi:hypothetical protein